jgi:hypothetical protein
MHDITSMTHGCDMVCAIVHGSVRGIVCMTLYDTVYNARYELLDGMHVTAQ